MGELIYALVTICALLASGLLGTVEAAVSSISRARVEQLHKDEVPGSISLLKVLDRRPEHINLLVLLRMLLDVTAAVSAACLALSALESTVLAISVAIVGMTLISFTVVGVFSRTMGRKNPYTISLRSALLLSGVARILGPIPRMLIWAGNLLAPGSGFRDGPYATEVELREMVDIAQEHGVVEVEERRMIQSVFDLASTTARQVMVPRPEMIWIEEEKTAGQATSLCVRSGHSRLPVTGENLDDIVGIVYLKDLVKSTYHAIDGGSSVKVSEVMRPPVFVPDSKPLDALLHEMQTDHTQLAILIDEFGGVAGLISMEDILEEIVGEIADEYDDFEIADFEQVGERSFRTVSWLNLDDLAENLNEALDTDIEFDEEIDDQIETVAGLIAYEIGRVPLPGSKVAHKNLMLTAEGARDRRGRLRVRSVLVEVAEATEDEETSEEDE